MICEEESLEIPCQRNLSHTHTYYTKYKHQQDYRQTSNANEFRKVDNNNKNKLSLSRRRNLIIKAVKKDQKHTYFIWITATLNFCFFFLLSSQSFQWRFCVFFPVVVASLYHVCRIRFQCKALSLFQIKLILFFWLFVTHILSP